MMPARLVTLLSAAMVILMAVPAFAGYAPKDDQGTPTISCVVTVHATATTEGRLECVAPFLEVGTKFTFSVTFPLAATASLPSNRNISAVAFVGAQEGGFLRTISGTVDADGVARGSGVIPAGADSHAEVVVALNDTAPLTFYATLNDFARPPALPRTDGLGTAPITGAESTALVLMAFALAGAGSGAILLARRRSRIEP